MARLVAVLLIQAFLLGSQVSGSSSLPTVIQGTVVDPRGLPYGCEHETCVVTVSGAAFRKELKLDINGRFRIEVTPGIYRVSSTITGTYPVRRAAISLKEGEVATLTLVPQMRVESMGTSFRELTTEELPIQNSATNALVEYANKKSHRGTIIYSDAVFSYQDIAVYADTISYTPATGKLVAVGDPVRFDKGGSRLILTRLRATFSGSSYSFEIESAKR